MPVSDIVPQDTKETVAFCQKHSIAKADSFQHGYVLARNGRTIIFQFPDDPETVQVNSNWIIHKYLGLRKKLASGESAYKETFLSLDRSIRAYEQLYVRDLAKLDSIGREYVLFSFVFADESENPRLMQTVQGGGALESNWLWFEWMHKAYSKQDKREMLRLIDQFTRSFLHEQTHHYQTEEDLPGFIREGLPRVYEYVMGKRLFNRYAKELDEVRALLDGKPIASMHMHSYVIGLYVFLVLFLHRLSATPEFRWMQEIAQFSSEDVDGKFKILANFNTLARRAGYRDFVRAHMGEFRNEMASTSEQNIRRRFREAERSLGIQLPLPKQSMV